MGKRSVRLFFLLAAILLVWVGQAVALPFNGSPLADANDSYWELEGKYTATILMENANYRDRNSFGLYYGSTTYELLTGAQGVNDSVVVDFTDQAGKLGSSSFGFYLKSPDGWFYSDSSLNRDNKTDHMLAYLGNEGEFFLAFEDLRNGGDFDYDDLVIAIRKYIPSTAPAPVPEPGTLLLLGSGLLGLAYRRKNRSA
ncbi:MAG: DUF4114 domain-containing protein [Desulfuromonadales bacterium]|nr:DUF4114 domain-containing protein [Desulfuromonadales bacterium]